MLEDGCDGWARFISSCFSSAHLDRLIVSYDIADPTVREVDDVGDGVNCPAITRLFPCRDHSGLFEIILANECLSTD